jgi:hypothetical protein
MISSKYTTKQYILNDPNVLLDSGTTFTRLEEKVVEQIHTDLGATVDNFTGYPMIDCSARSWSGGVAFGFSGKSVLVTYRDLIFTYQGLCALGIQAVGAGGQQVLGVPFLRAAYGKSHCRHSDLDTDTMLPVVYDFDNKNIHLAQAGNCTEDLVSIGSGVSAVPNVTGSCYSVPSPTPLESSGPSNIIGLVGLKYTLPVFTAIAAAMVRF